MKPDTELKRRLASRRMEIDCIDAEILALLNRRLRAARAIGELKRRHGGRILDPARETAVVNNLIAQNRGPLANADLTHIFDCIMNAAKSVQQPEQDPGHAQPPGLTPLYGVFGDPIAHSLSPLMHGRAFSRTGADGVYLAFRIKDIAAGINAVRTLGIKGVSITLPHKVAAVALMDRLDDSAQKIGAVNTVFNRDGVLTGYNSDGAGAMAALKRKVSPAGRRVLLLGAGGAARAIGFSIMQQGGRLTVANRSEPRGRQLAAALGADFIPLSEAARVPADILINATAVGMAPHTDAMPLSSSAFRRHMCVMDIVYTPLKTRWLRAAAQAGCRIVDGLEMFVHQGAFQFELWTGRKAPVDAMRQAVESVLSPDDEHRKKQDAS